MMKAARIDGGIVAELWDVPSLDCFDGVVLIAAPDECAVGWGYAGGIFTAPAATPAETLARLEIAVQYHLDAAAQAEGYESIISACSYAGAPNPFQAESAAFLSWRASVWVHCYQVLADVQGGLRPIPTDAVLIAELPTLVLP